MLNNMFAYSVKCKNMVWIQDFVMEHSHGWLWKSIPKIRIKSSIKFVAQIIRIEISSVFLTLTSSWFLNKLKRSSDLLSVGWRWFPFTLYSVHAIRVLLWSPTLKGNRTWRIGCLTGNILNHLTRALTVNKSILDLFPCNCRIMKKVIAGGALLVAIYIGYQFVDTFEPGL